MSLIQALLFLVSVGVVFTFGFLYYLDRKFPKP